MTIEEDRELGTIEYWDKRYLESDGETPVHEWIRSFEDLESVLTKHLFEAPGRTAKDDPLILHLGSGDSVIPAELARRGYARQLCVDFSPRVVEFMTERHRDYSIEWKQMDVRDMFGIDSKSVDVAFDKSTMDAMIYGNPWTPPDEVVERTSKYLREVHRTLKDDGIFLCVTFRQPHFMRPLLNLDSLWDLEMELLQSAGTFDYYLHVLRKVSRIRT